MNRKGKFARVLYVLSLVIFIGIAVFGSYLLYAATDESTPQDPSSPSITDVITKSITPIKTPVNVLMMAAAIRGDGVILTDTIMVIHFDPVTCETKIISVLRDTQVFYEYSRKINEVYVMGGYQAAAETVSKLLGINIDYYVFTSAGMISDIVDELGGAWYDVPCRMKYSNWINLQKGYQRLNGNKVVQLLRFRHPDLNGNNSYAECPMYVTNDVQRAKTQQSFITAFVKQKAKPEYFNKMASVVKIVFDNTKTDLKLNTILRLLYNKTLISPDKITTYSINSVNSIYNGTLKDNTHDKVLSLDETNQLLSVDFATQGYLSKATLSDSLAYRGQIGASHKPSKNNSTPKPTKKPTSTPKPTGTQTSKPNNTPKPVVTSAPTEKPVPTNPPATEKPVATAEPT